MADQDSLPWRRLDDLMIVVGAFLDPVLGDPHERTWQPNAWRWEEVDPDEATGVQENERHPRGVRSSSYTCT
jgi:hypothetical protein